MPGIFYIIIVVFVSATERGDSAHKNGTKTLQNRDSHISEKLHYGPDERHMRNEGRGETLHVSKLNNWTFHSVVKRYKNRPYKLKKKMWQYNNNCQTDKIRRYTIK